ncbi:MAG: ATP12 family protein [Hyphomicrobiaceae bacterium]
MSGGDASDKRGGGNGKSAPGRADVAKPKRFYEKAEAGERDGAHVVLLDGRAARTPGRQLLALPTRALAERVAGEWAAQGATLEPLTMPLTRLINSVLEGVRGREREVAADIAQYARSDLVCYRADGPAGLCERQSRHWDPVVAWAEQRLGVRLMLATGIMPVDQAPALGAAMEAALAQRDTFALGALHVMTTLLGSALLALAVAEGQLSPATGWAASHVDEDWQIAQWGEDAEAAARREARRREYLAAVDVLLLSGPDPQS